VSAAKSSGGHAGNLAIAEADFARPLDSRSNLSIRPSFSIADHGSIAAN